MKITEGMLYQHAAEARSIWLATLPANDEIPEYHFSRRFERKMRQLIKEQRRSPKVNRVLRYLQRTVVAVLVAIVIVFSGLMTVEAYQKKVIEIIVHVFNEFTHYRFVSSTTDMTLPTITFSYLPEGMEQAEYRENEMTSYIRYEDGDGGVFEVRLEVVVSGSISEEILDTEDAVSGLIHINDSEVIVNTKNGQSVLIWSDHNVIYHIYGNIDLDELIKIAENIKFFSE